MSTLCSAGMAGVSSVCRKLAAIACGCAASIVTSARQSEIDSGLERISSRIQDPLQRDIVTAMLYDQLKLGTNLSLLAPHLRATRVAGAGR